jgi:acyl carrier protein
MSTGSSEATSEPAAKSRTSHRGVAVALVVLATIIGIVALISTWTKREVFNTDQWVKTSSALLANEEIRTQLADDLTTQVFSSGVVQAEVAKALPPKAAVLAGPASAGLSQLFNKAVDKLLQTSAVQNLWEEANRKASETFIAIAEDKPIATTALGEAQSKLGGTSLDLTSIKAAITEKLGIQLPESGLGSGEAAQAAVQAGNGEAALQVIAPDQISTLRDIANLIQKGSVVLLLLTFLLYGIAIAITPGTRLRTLTSVGVSLILVGVATLTVRKLLGTTLVNELAASDSTKPAVSEVWSIATELMQTMAVATIAYGVVVLAGTVLAGPTKAATWVREKIAPALRDPMWATFGTAMILLILVWWGPTPALHEGLGILLISALVIAGIVALRHQTNREFPATEQPTKVA